MYDLIHMLEQKKNMHRQMYQSAQAEAVVFLLGSWKHFFSRKRKRLLRFIALER